MRKIGLLCFVYVFALFGCTIADEDRCPKGYEYLAKDKFCYLIVDASEEEEDAGETGDAGDLPEGFWKECETEGDCADNGEADYCIISGTGEGNCTKTSMFQLV